MKKNTQKIELIEVARRYFGQSFGKPTSCEPCVTSKDFITDGSVIICRASTTYENADYTIDDRLTNRNADAATLRKAVVPYMFMGRVDVPKNLYGAMQVEISKFFTLAMRGRWCAFYAVDFENGVEFQDGGEICLDAPDTHAYMFHAGNVRQFFRRFTVKSVKIGFDDHFKSLELEFTFKGEEFRAVVLNSIDETGVTTDAASLVEKWDAQDRERAGEAVEEVVEAVAKAPAEKIAAMDPPKANKEPERPEGVKVERDLATSFEPGDVVRVYGVTGKTGKTKNGFYYVSNAYGDGDLHLVSLKKANGSEFEGIGKRSEYWPFKHCYSSRPDIRKEYMENVRGARIENLGPVSLAVYSEFVEELKGLEKDEKDAWRANPERVARVRAIVERMAAENPALEGSRKWREEHPVKLDGPGLRISRNGLDVREKNGSWTHYALTIQFQEGESWKDGRECVYVYASWGRSSWHIPAGFALDVKNDTDSMTDYFDTDSARVFPGHPLYGAFKAVAQGGKAYTLTDEDAEALKAYTEARKADAEAGRKAEAEREREEEERKERHAREVIAEYAELFPGDAYRPHVVVQWSELGAMAEHAIEYAGELNPDGATVFSVDAFENITGDLDDYFKDMRGYFKLKFTYFDGESEFTDRCDLGEGTGSYGSRMRQALEYVRKHENDQDDRVMLDGGATVTRDEYEGHARLYLDRIPATFDELNAV